MPHPVREVVAALADRWPNANPLGLKMFAANVEAAYPDVPPPAPGVPAVRLVVVEVGTGKKQRDVLLSGEVLAPGESIEAISEVAAVRFSAVGPGPVQDRIEVSRPLSLSGDAKKPGDEFGKPLPLMWPAGDYVLTCTPYASVADAKLGANGGTPAVARVTVKTVIVTPPPDVPPGPTPGDEPPSLPPGKKRVLVRAAESPGPAAVALAAGDQLLLERGAQWRGVTLKPNASNLYIGAFGTGARPKIVSRADGILIARDGLRDITIKGIEFECMDSNPDAGRLDSERPDGAGICVREQVTNLNVIDCVMRFYAYNALVINQGDMENQSKEIRFTRCGFDRGWSDHSSFHGQGIYAESVNGLHFDDCWFWYNGNVKRIARPTIYRHACYISAHHVSNVTGDGCLVAGSGGFGFQFRVPSKINNTLFYDNGFHALQNGPGRSEFTNNVMIGGHGCVEGDGIIGCGGLMFHSRDGLIQNGRAFGPQTGPLIPPYPGPALQVSPRANKQGWEYDKAVSADVKNFAVGKWRGPASKGASVGTAEPPDLSWLAAAMNDCRVGKVAPGALAVRMRTAAGLA